MAFILKGLFKNDRPLGERIHSAAKRNDLTGLQGLLPLVPNSRGSLEWEDNEAMTPLCIAAASGHWNCVEMLLKVGANHRACSMRKEGGTPLHEAVAKSQPACVLLLFNYGASPFVDNRFGESAYDLAVRRQNVEFMRMFEKRAALLSWLALKVPRNMGFNKEWKMHWLVLVVREQCPLIPPQQRVLHSQLFVYETQKSSRPKEKIFTDGAFFIGPPAPMEPWTLVLHPMAAKPTYLLATQKQESWQVSFCPCNKTSEANKYMEDLAKRINDTYFRALAHTGATPSPLAWNGSPRVPSARGSQPTAASNVNSHPVLAGVSGQGQAPATSRPQPSASGAGASSSQLDADAAMALALQREEALKAKLDPDELSQLHQNFSSMFSQPLPPREGGISASVGSHQGAQGDAGPSAVAPPATSANGSSEEDVCIICMEAPRQVGFLHGQSLHRCACKACATKWFQSKKTCPECNLAAQEVINCYG